MLAATAPGNPGVIARPITWDATLIEHHAVALNAVFATVQLLLGLGIALRPLTRFALAASVAWSLGVWWLGEGLGGVLNGTANPVSGAPGAVILYALLAVLLWPADRAGSAGDAEAPPFTAARAVGARAARVLWLVLWLSLAWFALQPANRAPLALHDLLAGQAHGEPGWLAGIENGAAAVVGSHGLAVSIVLAAACVLVAAGVWLPRPAARATLVLALVVAAADLGGRGGVRDDPRRGSDRPQLRAAARPAGAGLLAGEAEAGPRGTSVIVLTPVWILDVLAGGMLAVAGVSAARLAGARPWRRGTVVTDTDVGHLLMAIAMAGMLAGGLRTLPGAAWVTIFGVLTCWFGYRVARDAGAERCSRARRPPLHAAPGAQRSDGLHVPGSSAARGGQRGSGGHGLGGAGAQVSLPRVCLRADPGRVQRLGPRPAVRQALPAGVRGGHGRLPDRDERDDGVHAADHDLTDHYESAGNFSGPAAN